MNEKQVKLIRKYVRYCSGNDNDYRRIVAELKNMSWQKRGYEFQRMRDILNPDLWK